MGSVLSTSAQRCRRTVFLDECDRCFSTEIKKPEPEIKKPEPKINEREPKIKKRLLELSNTYANSRNLNLKSTNAYRKSRNGYTLQEFDVRSLGLVVERGDRACRL
jgi:hypothetical protein